MELKELIQSVCKEIPEELDAGITFEIGLNSDGKTINQNSLNRIKFSIKRK